MDIYETLVLEKENLLDLDLDFFESELMTNGIYDSAYKEKSLKLIKEIRESRKPKTKEKEISIPKAMLKERFEISDQILSEDELKESIIRKINNSETITELKELTAQFPILNEDLVDTYIPGISEKGMTLLLKTMHFSENFLDKYYNALNKKAIAKYQLFSEEFYLKHFDTLDADDVLQKGKNNWTKKENRSEKLDMFLRLRGIRI